MQFIKVIFLDIFYANVLHYLETLFPLTIPILKFIMEGD